MDTRRLKDSRRMLLVWKKVLDESIEEYIEAVDDAIEQAEVQAKSQRLSVTKMARLLGWHRTNMYKSGADKCNTYAELWEWVKENKPELLKTLEENYEQFQANQGRRSGNRASGNKTAKKSPLRKIEAG